ncbi:MAG TPA: hypothetical protein VHZ07_03645 [Bryobacteraceae bacterium]|nr:hypothetical protein [Bryobacteraceae bacterium]
MLNIFRRHVSACPNYGKRTAQKCPRRPPCPIHYEGIDGQGIRHRSEALIDPRTGNGIRDWARACEVVRDLEAPAPALVPERRTAIQAAIDHFVKLKESKSPDTRRKNRRVLMDFKSFMEASPRNYQFITDVRFSDLTDVASAWQGSNRSKVRDLGILTSFLKYCHRAEFTSKKHWRRIVQDLELAR